MTEVPSDDIDEPVPELGHRQLGQKDSLAFAVSNQGTELAIFVNGEINKLTVSSDSELLRDDESWTTATWQ